LHRSITFWKNFLFPKDILKEEGKKVKHVVFGPKIAIESIKSLKNLDIIGREK